ncbi:TRAP transporter large permease subunit [Methylobacterium nodulans]|uniref:TRAP dicarboxylate transporter, DctM subunit n=1 Tax=Methylobacterium nodulans (strain LMG 21967 / CNCM I-2342 / ORS 2060) TaxID=460265 RepID=B8IWB2_METNO|nr:TRAP transporter large permease subunit [Methylobacterium nodulans]ACL62702.1 TRAP dicarboxylate transporter, DctM subunit [Methylobacterium nodulans ORS 2060]
MVNILANGAPEAVHLGSAPAPEALPERGALARAYQRVMEMIGWLARAVLFVVLVGELCLILVEVSQRIFFGHSFLWAEEISRLALLTIAFIGGALAYRSHQHTTVALVTDALSAPLRRMVMAMIDVTILMIAAVAFLAATDLLQINAQSIMPMLQWNLGLTVVPFIAGMLLIGLFAIERLLIVHRLVPVVQAAIAAGIIGGIVYTMSLIPEIRLETGSALVAMLVVFFAIILLGLPVAFAMLLGSILFLLATDLAPTVAVAQNTIDGSGHFILLTLPFFIWAGMIMEKGGISRRLVGLAMALVGHFRGGLLQVVIMTTYLVSGVSGSKIADVVAVGSVMRDELERKGYHPKDGAAVLSASAAMSETIPPSIAMLVLGSVVPVSIGAMFIAGLLPAAVLALILMALVYVMAVRNPTIHVEKASRAVVVEATLGAILPLLMPAILVVGIKFGLATPTEVSSVAVLYGILLCALVYRSIGWGSFIKIAVECAITSGMVLFIIAAAGSFAWIMAAGNLPQHLVTLLHAAGDNRYLFLAGSILILIVVGSLLEGLPALIILGPILYPMATQLGIDGVHYAMVLLLSMGVGIFMPPLGIGFYVACSVMGTSVEQTSKAILPYLLALLFGILAVSAVPFFSLALLHVFGR